MSLRASLGKSPVIYEVVPPRRDTSRYNTELRGLEEVLHESKITAVNIPELVSRRKERGHVDYAPATIPPEEYAAMIGEYKEPIVNLIAPRLPREEFVLRAGRVLRDYQIPNLVLVGKERHGDVLPGPGVVEALRLLRSEGIHPAATGGICIFGRKSSLPDGYGGGGSGVEEPQRVMIKSLEGCDFVTSQIAFDPRVALAFLAAYQALCERSGVKPITVILSVTTIPSRGLRSLVEGLDVVIPPMNAKRLRGSENIGEESLALSTEVFRRVISGAEDRGITIPIGLQIEQIGTTNDQLSLRLLDSIYSLLR